VSKVIHPVYKIVRSTNLSDYLSWAHLYKLELFLIKIITDVTSQTKQGIGFIREFTLINANSRQPNPENHPKISENSRQLAAKSTYGFDLGQLMAQPS
jgi:hypothetical protein